MNHPPNTTATTNDTIMDEFRAGVTACLRSWSALRTAVQSGWGGVDSFGKAEELRQHIFEHCNGQSFPPRGMDVMDLEDNLAIFMEEEFSVVLEDNSERQIAETIWRMYEQCHQGDTTLARQMVAIANDALACVAEFPVQIQSTECDDDDDDDEDDEMDETTEEAPSLVAVQGTNVSAREYANQYVFGPPRGVNCQEAPATEEPEVDEDGFVAVPVKGKKKR